MFIPTFPVGKQRSIHCQACGNSFDTKGSAPFWTFLGGVILAVFFLAGAAHQAIRRFGLGASTANIASVASAPSTTASAPAASASAPPHAAAPHAPVAASAPQPVAASSKGASPASSASGTRRKKKK